MPEFHRDVDAYVDIAGRSDVKDALRTISRSDRRGSRAIESRLRILRECESLADLTATSIVKRPTAHIYVLRVQSGSISYRLPFFEAPDRGGKLVILTHCEYRSLLKGDQYRALVEAAERRRQDWIRRNPKEEDDEHR